MVLWTAERGEHFPNQETIAQIEGATGGMVTASDHAAAWRRAHLQTWKRMFAKGLAARRGSITNHSNGGSHGRKAKGKKGK